MCDISGCATAQAMPPIKLSGAARRAFLKGAASLPLSTVLFYPELAKAQASSLEPVSVETSAGKPATGFLARPSAAKAPAIVLIHEWWGLNDQIKAVAAELARQGYLAFAIDLYNGKLAKTPDEARSYSRGTDSALATRQLAAAIEYLRGHGSSTGKVATMGWCYGGGWSLSASIAAPVDATVIYYGNVSKPASDLRKLKGPVLGHFATQDRFINEDMVAGFERGMEKAGKGDSLTVHWYDADHAFANPTGSRYDAADAALAWDRTLGFLSRHL